MPRNGSPVTGDPPVMSGPSIAAAYLWASPNGNTMRFLNAEERAELSLVASIVRFKKGTQIYREGASANAVFNIIDGVVKTYRALPRRRTQVTAFLFANDLFGLAQGGTYVNSAAAVTAVTAYRLPVKALESRLRKNAALEFHVICKLCHELREAQRHAIMLGERSSLVRIALFLEILEHAQAAEGKSVGEVFLPMSRSDIADYVGMSLEAVSRSLRTLANQRVITLRDRRYVTIIDRARLEALGTRR